MAWLDARPGKSKASRREQFQRREDKDGTEAPELELPEVHEAVAHVLEYLFEVGPSVGEHPLTFGELEAWQRVTGVRIGEFEAFALRQLSGAYLAMRHEASDAKCPSPVMRASTLPSKEEVSNRLRDILRGMNSTSAKTERAKRQRERETEKADADG